MKEYISENRVANEIRMLRGPSFPGTFLIVEGTSDRKAYTHFVDLGSCRIVPAYNKENAIDALKILESYDFAGVLAIVDADFWRLEGKGKELDSQNLFITDTHDLETMILESPALDKLLTEFGSASKIKKLTQQSGENIRDILLNGGIQIGYLRWISHKEEHSLKFEGIAFGKFIDDETLKLDVAKMITEVKNKSRGRGPNEEDLQKSMRELANSNHDPWDVCCGHDLVCILSLGFRKALGSQPQQDVKSELIEKSLRLAYEATHFFVTQLYRSLEAWEKANSSFRIFPTP